MDPNKNRPTAKASIENPDSLYHEIKKLIQIRQSHESLKSRGTIEFVYAKKDQYPLAYLRESENEKILVVINPSAQAQSFDYNCTFKETIYSFGGETNAENQIVTIPGQSVGFYRI